MLYVIVFVGAGIGGALRHAVNLGSARMFGTGLPAGTLIVNVVGSFLLGAVAAYFLARPGVGQQMRLFQTTGILGGFTTFSAFSLDTALLMQRNAYGAAAGYVAGSVAASIGALFLGLALFRSAGLP